jgi:hypothetical protein
MKKLMRRIRVSTVLGPVCFALWLGLLAFGLWPFNFIPENRALWLNTQDGMHFDGYGQAYSVSPWAAPLGSLGAQAPVTIEIWIHPWQGDYPHFSPVFYIANADKSESFAIIQSGPDLLVRGRFQDHDHHLAVRKLWMDDACKQRQSIFITLSSDPGGSSLYLEGILQKHYPFVLSRDSLFGRLLLGHPPEGHQEWTGDILGLAIYDQALGPEEIAKHYKAWVDEGISKSINRHEMLAFYPFDERAGMIIHDRDGSAPDLVIPKKFRLLRRTILSREFDLDRSGLADIVVNIFGLVPFGFFLCAYLRHTKRLGWARSILAAILIGSTTSIMIELLQICLPTRDSSLWDVIDNTLGTAVGALLLFGMAARTGWARRLRDQSHDSEL